MKIICIVFLLFVRCFYSTIAAQQNQERWTSSDKQNMTVTQQDAFYPQGEQALYNYVMTHVRYSEEAKKNYLSGTVSLSFDVMPDSSVANVKIINDPGYGVGKEVKNLLEKLKFAPAVMMGVKVKSSLMMDFPVKAH